MRHLQYRLSKARLFPRHACCIAYATKARGLGTDQKQERHMRIVKWAAHAAAAAALARLPGVASAQTLKVVMHADVKIIDPFWTTAYIVRNYGYMVYDTLLAVDDKLAIKPQMLEGWKGSDDKLTYTLTLRDGLKFHDGAPVTAEDCVASLNRWAPKDAMGQKLMSFAKELKAVDD